MCVRCYRVQLDGRNWNLSSDGRKRCEEDLVDRTWNPESNRLIKQRRFWF